LKENYGTEMIVSLVNFQKKIKKLIGLTLYFVVEA